MIKVLATCIFMLAMISSVTAQVSVGISPMYSTQLLKSSFFSDTFKNSSINYEAEVGIAASRLTLKGYYLFNKEYSSQVEILNDTDKKTTLDFKYGFCASRAELGFPLIYKNSIIEPFLVDSYTKNYNRVTGDKLDYVTDLANHSQGIGLYYSQLIYKESNISAKGFCTFKDSMIDIQINKFNRKNSIGLGYTYRTYDNIKVSGPFINLLLTF